MEKSVFITGGAKRIGRAIARGLADKGYSIALHYNRSADEAKEVQKTIQEKGGTCSLYQCELKNINRIPDLLEKVFQDFPGTDVLINNASIFLRGGFLDASSDQFDDQFTVNMKVPFFLTQEFSRRCSEGNVINLLDTRISKDPNSYFIYTLTKKCLADFTRMAANALGPGIRVNGISPGLILPSADLSKEGFENLSSRIPLKKTGNPEYIVSAVFFLLDNFYVTGECLFVDGGEHLR